MDNPEECSVCFNRYNDRDRRPRTLPCGHNFCSLCLGDMLEDGKVSCPTCRTTHHATSISDFHINFGIEGFIIKMEAMKQMLASPSTETTAVSAGSDTTKSTPTGESKKKVAGTPISRKLQCMLEEQKSSVEKLVTGLDNVQSQLDKYRQQLDGWTTEHYQQLDALSILMERHKTTVKLLQQEDARVTAMKKKGEEGKGKLKGALETLQAVRTTQELVAAIDHTDKCSVEAEDWKQKFEDLFPDINAVTTSRKIRDDTRMALEIFPVQDGSTKDDDDAVQVGATQHRTTKHDVRKDITTQNAANKDSTTQDGATKDDATKDNVTYTAMCVQDQTFSITEKLKFLALEKPLTVKELCRLSDPVRWLVKTGAVYGVQQHQGRLRCSKITITDDRVYLHCLLDQPLPPHTRTLPVSKVLDIPNSSSTVAFLDLAWGGSTRGRVHFQLRPDNTLATQFICLCSGEQGRSYMNTVMLKVRWKGQPGERVVGGDYQYNTGEGGASLVTHIEDKSSGSVMAGTVWSPYGPQSTKSAQFCIITRDYEGAFPSDLPHVFGHVESGLEVFKEAINLSNIKQVTVVDCGVVLPIYSSVPHLTSSDSKILD